MSGKRQSVSGLTIGKMVGASFAAPLGFGLGKAYFVFLLWSSHYIVGGVIGALASAAIGVLFGGAVQSCQQRLFRNVSIGPWVVGRGLFGVVLGAMLGILAGTSIALISLDSSNQLILLLCRISWGVLGGYAGLALSVCPRIRRDGGKDTTN